MVRDSKELSVQHFLREKDYRDLIIRGGLAHLQQAPEKQYRPQDLKISGTYRFEGESNPDDMSVIYLLEGPGGLKAAIIDAFGTYSSPEIAEFVAQIPFAGSGEHLRPVSGK
jgi:hypothetical protein